MWYVLIIPMRLADTFKVRDFARNYAAYDIRIYLGSFFGATIEDLSSMDKAVVVAKLTLKKDDLSSGYALPPLAPLGSLSSKPSTTTRRPSIQGGLPGHRKSRSSYAPLTDFSVPPLPTFMPPLSAGSSTSTFSSSLSTSSSARSLGLTDTFGLGLGDPLLPQRPPSRTRRSSTSLGYSSQLPTLAPLPLFPTGSTFGSSIGGANSGLGGGGEHGHSYSSSFDSSASSLSSNPLFGASPSRSASPLRSSLGGGGGGGFGSSSSSSSDMFGPGWPYTTSSYSSGTPTSSSPPRKRRNIKDKKYQLLPSISTWAGPLNIPSNFANLPSPPPLFPPTPMGGAASRLPRSRTGSIAGSSYDFPPIPAFRPSSSLGRPSSRSGFR